MCVGVCIFLTSRSPDESPSISPTKNPESSLQRGSGVAQWTAATHEAGIDLRSSFVSEEVSEVQEADEMPAQLQAGEQQPGGGAPMVINGMKLDGAEGLPGIVVLPPQSIHCSKHGLCSFAVVCA